MNLLNDLATAQINEMVEAGWSFMLNVENKKEWEADFTKKLPSGLWDNHETGNDESPNVAVHKAYQNIKEGRRLKKK